MNIMCNGCCLSDQLTGLIDHQFVCDSMSLINIDICSPLLFLGALLPLGETSLDTVPAFGLADGLVSISTESPPSFGLFRSRGHGFGVPRAVL